MPVEIDRATSMLRITNPDDQSQYVDVKIINGISFIDPHEQNQEYRWTIHNTEFSTRVTHVQTVQGTSGSTVDVERVDIFPIIDPADRNQESRFNLVGNSQEPPVHTATHDFEITGPTGATLKLQRIDKLTLRDPHEQNQDKIYTLHWLDDDMSNPSEVDTSHDDTTDQNGNPINPPWRLDPFQNVIDVTWELASFCVFGGSWNTAKNATAGWIRVSKETGKPVLAQTVIPSSNVFTGVGIEAGTMTIVDMVSIIGTDYLGYSQFTMIAGDWSIGGVLPNFFYDPQGNSITEAEWLNDQGKYDPTIVPYGKSIFTDADGTVYVTFGSLEKYSFELDGDGKRILLWSDNLAVQFPHGTVITPLVDKDNNKVTLVFFEGVDHEPFGSAFAARYRSFDLTTGVWLGDEFIIPGINGDSNAVSMDIDKDGNVYFFWALAGSPTCSVQKRDRTGSIKWETTLDAKYGFSGAAPHRAFLGTSQLACLGKTHVMTFAFIVSDFIPIGEVEEIVTSQCFILGFDANTGALVLETMWGTSIKAVSGDATVVPETVEGLITMARPDYLPVSIL